MNEQDQSQYDLWYAMYGEPKHIVFPGDAGCNPKQIIGKFPNGAIFLMLRDILAGPAGIRHFITTGRLLWRRTFFPIERIREIVFYKRVHFVKIKEKSGSFTWSCRGNRMKFEFGRIRKCDSANNYRFYPDKDMPIGPDHIRDINFFINKELNKGFDNA